MYEPYQPDRTPDPEPAEGTGRPSALGECPCVADGRFCSPDCEQCPVDCPARQQVPHTWEQIPQYEEPAGHVDRQPSSWTSTSSRRRTSRRRSSSRSSFDWGTGSSSSGRSSSSASGSSRTPSKGKKAGAGLGAAIAAGAGGVGALSNGADGSSDA